MDRVSLRGDENILDMDSGDGFTKVGMYLRPLKIVNKIVNIKLNFIFYCNKKILKRNILLLLSLYSYCKYIYAVSKIRMYYLRKL